ncbi:hypothetical protein [Agrobacterium tumefaciens]|uniref:hypothetical protein n=1 Tax=Agrobacterium tumefaciens TaxID=358 RepID=UPI0015728C63|nr:hypothetical protein [Agrobacterium tumefaciens]
MSHQVNRYLKDKAMDYIDHALGRPVDPLIESHRNHFAVDAGSKTAKEFDASPFWDRYGKAAPGGMAFYRVNAEGRKALKRYLKEIGDKHRIYDVTYRGQTQSVVAVSAAKAKYSLWLDISDSFCDLTFGTFCRAATVRKAV